MKEVKLSPECDNILIFLNNYEFIIKNQLTQRFIIDQNNTTFSYDKARRFQIWRDFDNRYKTFVAQSEGYDRLIYNDGTCSRNYNSIGDLSTDGSRPANIKINEEDHWFYLEGFKENKTSYPYKKEIKGSKFELKPRICGYNVVSIGDDDRIKSWLSWEKNAWHYNFKNYTMNHFERISEETSKVFKGVKKDLLTGKTKYRVFMVNRDLDKDLSKPYISPDYYIAIEPDTQNKLLYVTLEDESKAVILYNEGKLKYWPMTNQGLYCDYKYKEGYLICYRHNNTIDILDKTGLSLTSFWKNFELMDNYIRYENYFGQTKQCEFNDMRKEYDCSAEELKRNINILAIQPFKTTKINISDKERIVQNTSSDAEIIQFASITNSIKEYSSHEYSYTGFLKVINDNRGKKINKDEPVIFIWPKKNLFIKAVYKAQRGKNFIFECIEKHLVDLNKRDIITNNYFTKIDYALNLSDDPINFILNKLCPIQNSTNRAENIEPENSGISKEAFLNNKTVEQQIDISIDLNLEEQTLEKDIVDVYKFLSRNNLNKTKINEALALLFEERLFQKYNGVSSLDKIKESLKTEPDYNNVLKTIYSQLDERENFEFNYRYTLLIRFERYSPKEAIIEACKIVRKDNVNFINWAENLLKPYIPDIDCLEAIKIICAKQENQDKEYLNTNEEPNVDKIKIKTGIKERNDIKNYVLKIEGKEIKKGDILPKNIISVYQRIFFKKQFGAIFIKINEKEISTRNTKNEYSIYGVGGDMMVFLEGNENYRIKSQKYPIVLVKKDKNGNYRYYDLAMYKDHYIEKDRKGEKILFTLKKI